MSHRTQSMVIGAYSGIATFVCTFYALARTSAIPMPHGFPLYVWDSLVVFGLGVTLVALLIHFVGIAVLKPKPGIAFVGFLAALIAPMAIGGLLHGGGRFLVAAIMGAGLATLFEGLRARSFKRKLLNNAT